MGFLTFRGGGGRLPVFRLGTPVDYLSYWFLYRDITSIALTSDLVRLISGGACDFEDATDSALTEHFADSTR